MFWIEKYRPEKLDDIRGQDAVRDVLAGCVQKRTLPHLLITGPHGTGKSSAILATIKEIYKERWQEYTTIFPTADLFLHGKKFLMEDDRFSHIFKKDQSFITNLKNAVNWYAAIKPFDESFRVIIFEDAGALSHDAQQALRRIMERYSETCRFIFITPHASALIPPICSRCLPLYFTPISTEKIAEKIRQICVAEGITPDPLSRDDISLVSVTAQGDLRKAIMYTQVLSATHNTCDISMLNESKPGILVREAFMAMEDENSTTARELIETAMIQNGISSTELLEELRRVIKREYNHPVLASFLADTDFMLLDAQDPYVHINALVSRIITGVFAR